MKKIITLLAAALMTTAMAVSAFAAGSFTGKVTKVDGEKVVVKVDGGVPGWAKAGATVKASGGAPKVLSVKGNEVTLKFGKAKAAKIKTDTSMTVSETGGEEMQGC
jgi:hypothetical protein